MDFIADLTTELNLKANHKNAREPSSLSSSDKNEKQRKSEIAHKSKDIEDKKQKEAHQNNLRQSTTTEVRQEFEKQKHHETNFQFQQKKLNLLRVEKDKEIQQQIKDLQQMSDWGFGDSQMSALERESD